MPQKTGNKFKKVLVTGGAGYVGSSLISILLKEGYKVRVFDNLRFGPEPIFPFFMDKNFEFVKGDIRNKDDVKKVVNGVDVIIHLAAIVGFPACRKDPVLARETNVDGTRNVVEAADGKIPVIFASTGSTYGKMLEDICTETTPLNPLTDYGKHKVEAEKIVETNKEFVIFRFATAFGVSARMRFDLLPNDFTYQAVRAKSIIVYERHFMRTFIHVRDMGYALLFALQNYDKMKGEAYNVGSNDMNHSKETICNMLSEKVDYYLHFADIAKDLDQRDYIVSYDKLENLGYKISIGMEDGIDELIKVCELVEIKNPYYNV